MSDYKERLKQERDELLDRVRKLDIFVCKQEFKNLGEHDQHLLEIQKYAMETYLACLNRRMGIINS